MRIVCYRVNSVINACATRFGRPCAADANCVIDSSGQALCVCAPGMVGWPDALTLCTAPNGNDDRKCTHSHNL